MKRLLLDCLNLYFGDFGMGGICDGMLLVCQNLDFWNFGMSRNSEGIRWL